MTNVAEDIRKQYDTFQSDLVSAPDWLQMTDEQKKVAVEQKLSQIANKYADFVLNANIADLTTAVGNMPKDIPSLVTLVLNTKMESASTDREKSEVIEALKRLRLAIQNSKVITGEIPIVRPKTGPKN